MSQREIFCTQMQMNKVILSHGPVLYQTLVNIEWFDYADMLCIVGLHVC